MATVPATRTELLTRRQQIGLALRGQELLERKRETLARELLRISAAGIEQADELERAAASTRDAMDLAKALDGPEAVASASLAARASGDRFEVSVTGSFIFGVPVPEIQLDTQHRGPADRGYSLEYSSARVDRLASAAEEELHWIVRLAETDASIRRLSQEVERTGRRVNALHHFVIPNLEGEVRRISEALEEREREEHFRLKRFKQLLRPGSEVVGRITDLTSARRSSG